MKTLVGIISGLLLVVAVAGFAPSDASAHAIFFPATLGDHPVDVIAGCVDAKVADTLIASGAFVLDPSFICSSGPFVIRVLPLP